MPICQHKFLQNIGEGGTFLRTNERFGLGVALHLQFSLPESEKIFEVDGVIEWSTYGEQKSRTLFGGYGLKFTGIEEDDRAILRRFVNAEMNKITAKKTYESPALT